VPPATPANGQSAVTTQEALKALAQQVARNQAALNKLTASGSTPSESGNRGAQDAMPTLSTVSRQMSEDAEMWLARLKIRTKDGRWSEKEECTPFSAAPEGHRRAKP
jgi:hypothetical protein